MKFPEHLKRQEISIQPDDKNEGCKKIREEITEEVIDEPAYYQITQKILYAAY